MNIVSDAAVDRGEARHTIEVADTSLKFRAVPIKNLTPTGAQLAEAAGFTPDQQATVLHFLANGELEDVLPDQTVDLRHGDGRFVIVVSDRLYRLTIDGETYDWPCQIISGEQLRKLGRVPADKAIYLERRGEPDQLIGSHDLVDLAMPGIEKFVTRVRVWKLNVQGVILELHEPTIVVREAIRLAGFNPDQGWHIFLKVEGEPKREVGLDYVVDLRTPGIEKIRLVPKEVNNGEAPTVPRRDFAILDGDAGHLRARGLRWETVIEDKRRWLVIYDYPIPAGYTAAVTTLALEIPPTYPGAQIYGFFSHPPLALINGRAIPNTQFTDCDWSIHFWRRAAASMTHLWSMSNAVRYFCFRSSGIRSMSLSSPSKYFRLSIMSGPTGRAPSGPSRGTDSGL